MTESWKKKKMDVHLQYKIYLENQIKLVKAIEYLAK